MKCLLKIVVLIILVIIGIGAWVWTGAYNVAADSPHWAVTRHFIGEVREHSIDRRIKAIKVPNLEDPALIAEGAHHYARMCTECHLAPGMTESETRVGLNPRPPNLTRFSPGPAEAFWIIKHGIKMTAMPAWGKTHSDQKIWAMVAYLQKQPHMSAAEFRKLADVPANMMLMGEDDDHEYMPAPAAVSSAPATAASAPAAMPMHP